MGETEKLLSKKATKRERVAQKSNKEQKLFNNQDDYGTLTKQYIVEDEYPRTHFSALHCVVVSFVFIFCIVFITTSLLIGLPRVRQRYQQFHDLDGLNATVNPNLPAFTTTFGSII